MQVKSLCLICLPVLKVCSCCQGAKLCVRKFLTKDKKDGTDKHQVRAKGRKLLPFAAERDINCVFFQVGRTKFVLLSRKMAKTNLKEELGEQSYLV